MNDYKFSELRVGQSESFAVTVTKAMTEQFKAITGDNNPLHTDENFAKAKGHPGCVVYGLLTASFLSTLAGVYLPGKNSLIHSIETKFVKPVYVGDTLTVTGEVKELMDTFSAFSMKVWITNQSGDKVLRGTMQIGVLN